ncbi:hypothetical protein [Streptacidiphilus sp. PAMC 29251]
MVTDVRRVQTAVCDDAQSDSPIVLPLEVIEAAAFRRSYAHSTFWCGVLLGGCGGQLSTKLYTDRACHFAHFPHLDGSPRVCRRAQNDVSSADHLFIKSDLTRWLERQGIAATGSFPELTGGIGSMVDLDLQSGARLTIHIGSSTGVPDWTQANGLQVILGPGVEVSRGIWERCRYINRIRMESEGTRRRPVLGTQIEGVGTDWFQLEECRFDERGLITPAVTRILAEEPPGSGQLRPRVGGHPRPTNRPPQHHPAQPRPQADEAPDMPMEAAALLSRLRAATRSGEAKPIRLLYAAAEVRQHSSPPLTAAARDAFAVSLAQAREVLTQQQHERDALFESLANAIRAGNAPQVRALLVRARDVTQHGGASGELGTLRKGESYLRQERTGLSAGRRTPARKVPVGPTREQKKAAARTEQLLVALRKRKLTPDVDPLRPWIAELQQVAAAAADVLSRPQRAEVTGWAERVLPDERRLPRPGAPAAGAGQSRPRRMRISDSLVEPRVKALRAELMQAARGSRTVTLSQLLSKAQKPGEGSLPSQMVVELLVRVDQDGAPRNGLLSALVTGEDHEMHPYFRQVAERLGQPLPEDPLAAAGAWAMAVALTHHKRR